MLVLSLVSLPWHRLYALNYLNCSVTVECITGALVRGVGVGRCGDLVISQYAAQGRSAWWILARTPDDSDCVLAPRDQYHALIR